MKTKTKRIIIWFICNTTMYALTFMTINGNEGAYRLLLFITSILGFTGTIALFSKDCQKSIRDRGRFIPKFLSHGTGLILIGLLVWNDFILIGVFVLITELAEAISFLNEGDKPCQ
jgi:hypothetical protein